MKPPALTWEKLEETPYRAGYRKMLKRKFLMPDGRVQEFDVKDEGKPVCVLALTASGNVVLAKQFRPGPEKVLLELPGGGMESGETPEEAMRRELLEETGYAGGLHFVGTSLCCAYSTRLRYNFVALDCRKVQEPANDENEFIEVVEMPLEDFKRHLRGGELTDVATGYLGLDFIGHSHFFSE